MRKHFIQISKYGFFGIIATLIYLLIAWSGIYFLNLSVYSANMTAFFTAFAFSYIFQTLFVFQTYFHLQKFIKFFLVQYGAFLASYFISTFVQLQNNYLHTLIISAIIPLFSFFIHKIWTFKTKQA